LVGCWLPMARFIAAFAGPSTTEQREKAQIFLFSAFFYCEFLLKMSHLIRGASERALS
jgi:hypothetical protein